MVQVVFNEFDTGISASMTELLFAIWASTEPSRIPACTPPSSPDEKSSVPSESEKVSSSFPALNSSSKEEASEASDVLPLLESFGDCKRSSEDSSCVSMPVESAGSEFSSEERSSEISEEGSASTLSSAEKASE